MFNVVYVSVGDLPSHHDVGVVEEDDVVGDRHDDDDAGVGDHRVDDVVGVDHHCPDDPVVVVDVIDDVQGHLFSDRHVLGPGLVD